jgi:ornithine cyclodeaminase/alanine dehydrogenase-like protein (mu-crystallin family)
MISLSKQEIINLNIKNSDIKKWVKEAFLSKKYSNLPHKISQTFNDGKNFYNTMPAIMPTIDSAGVKIVSRYSERKPTIKGDILLYSLGGGELLSVMDATWITSKRTGAVASLAVETFAKKDYKSIAIIGLGETGKSFLDMFIAKEENKNKHIKLMEYKDRANAVNKYLNSKGIHNISICSTYEELIKDSDVIVSAVTVAESEFGKDEWFKKGCLVVPIHTRGFQNCDLFFDKVFADDTSHVEGFKHFNRFNKFNEIDRVLHKDIIGRENDDERILSYNIGIALHDIYIARKIYNLGIDDNNNCR